MKYWHFGGNSQWVGFPGGSGGKESTYSSGDPGLISVSKRSPTWQPIPVFLSGESHGQRSLVGYSPWDHKKPDTTEWLTLAFIVWMVTEGWWVFYLSLEVRGHYFQCCCCEVSGNWSPTSMCVIISFSLWDFEILYSFLVFWRTNIYWDDVT